MKKKFLLAIIPALMALSSCAGAGQKVDIKNDNIFVEDTLAHEEIFGDSKIEFQDYKAPLKAPSGPVAPIYGVQYQESSDGEHVHMRFIAATWINSSSTAVKWTRTMYKGHGNGDQNGHVFKEEADKACTKAYTSLANGSEEAMTISSINAQYGDGDDYNYFVVYTMLNIPKTTYDDYAIRANITIGSLESSTGIAATVGQTAYATFNMDQDDHFISGRFNGVHDEFEPEYDEEKGETKGDNNAVYYGVDLHAGDTFALVYFDSVNNVFLLNGMGRDGDGGYFCDNSKKTMTSKFEGSFTIYLNGSDMIYLAPNFDLVRPIYVDVSNRTWWGEETDGHIVAVWAFGGTKDDEWIKLNRIGESNLYVTPNPIDPTDHDQYIVVDFEGNTPSWDDSKIKNRTKDSDTINARGKSDCLKIWDQDTSNDYKWWVSWVQR